MVCTIEEGQATSEPLSALEEALGKLNGLIEPFATEARTPDPMAETWKELISTQTRLSADIEAFTSEVAAKVGDWEKGRSGATREETPYSMRRAKGCTMWPNAAGT